MKTTLINKAGNTQSDLTAYNLIKPVTGKFLYLSAIKDDDDICTTTTIEFENLKLILTNLNIGFGGEGPGGLISILLDLGMERNAAERLVKENKVSVEFGDSSAVYN